MIDAFATQPHYLEHIAPVWHALPPEVRGAVYVGLSFTEFADLAIRLRLPIAKGRPPWPGRDEPLVMAGGSDLQMNEGRSVVLLEHGAGQTYVDVDNVGYAGGFGRDAVKLFLCPSVRAARLNKDRYPNAKAVAVGAPTVEPWNSPEIPNVLAFSFHWDCSIAVETRATWPYWQSAVAALAKERPVLGHAHPKARQTLEPWYKLHGIEFVPDWRDVVERAGVYACDNSSTIYEFAATGRPVIVLNAPQYRRNVEHGLRFWDLIPGLECSHPDELLEASVSAFATWGMPAITEYRRFVTEHVYAAIGFEAARHAAYEIMQIA